MVVWITGLSGVGKTTVGERLWRLWRQSEPNTVLIDGDVVRQLFGMRGEGDPYSLRGRRENAERIVEMCCWLDRQDINIVCCLLAVFDDILDRNRGLFARYLEARLVAPLEILRARDPKGLYSRAAAGELRNMVGVDLPYDLRSRPDMLIDTSGARSAEQIAADIHERVKSPGRA